MTITINAKTLVISVVALGIIGAASIGWCIYKANKFTTDVEQYCKESYQLYVLGNNFAEENLTTWSNSIGSDFNAALAELLRMQEVKGRFGIIDSLMSITEKLESDIEGNSFGNKDIKNMAMDVYSKTRTVVKMGKSPDGSLMNYGQRLESLKSEAESSFSKLFIKASIPEKMADSVKISAARLLLASDIRYELMKVELAKKGKESGIKNFKAKYPKCKSLPNGVLYYVEKEGNGKIPHEKDCVDVIYTAEFEDGTVFDSSLGQSVSFSCYQVIEGWKTALTHMPVGSKWVVFIPYDMAYGEQGSGPVLPYMNLIFKIELLSIR